MRGIPPRARAPFGTVTLAGAAALLLTIAIPPESPNVRSHRELVHGLPIWAQCPGAAIIRPASGECVAFDDASPLLDPIAGVYRADLDRTNWVSPDGVTLELLAVHVLDNGEGPRWPHGPHGNIYFDFFSPDEPLEVSPDGADLRRIASPRVLRGPHRTHGRTDEWLDDELLAYRGAGLFRWGSAGGSEEAVVMRIWESDSLSEDGRWGRRNDVLGMVRIDRAATEVTDGVWLSFYKFSGEHPRRRRDDVAVRALVRTRPAQASVRALPRGALLARGCNGESAAPLGLCEPYRRHTPWYELEDPLDDWDRFEPRYFAQGQGHSWTGAPERTFSR